MSSPARILLLRHGQSTWNADGRWQGWADAPLSPLGEAQARDAAAHLRGLSLDGVVSSDLIRARRTAELIVASLGLDLEVVVDPALRERDVGAFSGLTRAQIDQRFPGVLEGESGDPVEAVGGERLEVFVGRVMDALQRIGASYPGRHVLATTHGGVVRWVERELGAEVPAQTFNCSGRWVSVSADGSVHIGDSVVPVDPAISTAPPNH